MLNWFYLSLLLAFGVLCLSQGGLNTALPIFGFWLLLTTWIEWSRPQGLFNELKTIQHFLFLIAVGAVYACTERAQGIDEGVGILLYIILQSVLIYRRGDKVDLEGLHMDKALGCLTLFAALNWPNYINDLTSVLLGSFALFYLLLFFCQSWIKRTNERIWLKPLLLTNVTLYGSLMIFTMFKIMNGQ